MCPDNSEVDKSLKGLPNRKSKDKVKATFRVDRQTHEDFIAECHRAGLRSCSVIETFERLFLGMRSLEFQRVLAEFERPDRIERKREVFTHILSTQTQNRDKRRLQNVRQFDGNLPAFGVCEVGGCFEPSYGEVVYRLSGERHWVCKGHFELFRGEPFVDRGIFKGSARALL
jgi:hypothetical protein